MTACDFIIAIFSFGFCCFTSKFAAFLVSFISKLIVSETERDRELRKNIRKLTEEINEISAVDEFARHSRKNRELTKLRSELKTNDSSNMVTVIKLTFAVQILFHIIAICFGFYTLYVYHHVPMLTFPSSWFYPLNSLMAWPGLNANDTESPISAFFLLAVVWNLSRITSVVTPW